MYGKAIAGDFQIILMLTSYFPLVKGEPQNIFVINMTVKVFTDRRMQRIMATFWKQDCLNMKKSSS